MNGSQRKFSHFATEPNKHSHYSVAQWWRCVLGKEFKHRIKEWYISEWKLQQKYPNAN